MAARRRHEGRRGVSPRRRTAALFVTAVALLAAGAVTAWAVLSTGSDGESGPPTAAIVDQLSLTFPNPDFIATATATLERAGYEVDYFPGEEATVALYRRLPSHDYDVVLFRNHADRLQAREQSGEEFDEVVLFTSEPYDPTRYAEEQSENNLVIARYVEGGESLFGVSAGFVEDDMSGDFDGATIIMLGCEGLLTDTTAEAFMSRGASSYISWDETVSASHNDIAGERLLELLFLDGLSPAAAAEASMAELGPDPAFGSRLEAFPGGE